MTVTADDRWSDARLSAWRDVADDPADRAVAAYFSAVDDREPRALMASLVAHTRLPPEDRVPAIAEFLDAAAVLPDWADAARIGRGQQYFSDWALHHFTALYLASLPNAYAAAEGVHVLWLTARLQDDAERRLNETAQFLMDVTAPDGFAPGGSATQRVLHVRLMHAAVRWLIEHDTGVARPASGDPSVLPVAPMWATSWGRPVNQEDLAGTMLTFTTVVFDAFVRSGLDTPAAGREDYLHLWRVIAHLLGVRDELLPRDVADAHDEQRAIFRRLQAPSAVGAELTSTLLAVTGRRLPGPAARVAPAMMRRFLGDDVASMIDVPPTSLPARLVLSALVWCTKLTSFGRRADPFPRWLSARVGRWMLDGLLSADRGGARVPFAIPDQLGELR